MLRCRRLAEDIAQQTFERVWRHAGNYDERRASVRTWVLMICRRLAIDASRLRRSEPMAPDALDPLLPPSADRLPEDRATDAVAVIAVRRALGGLPEAQRRAVLLASLGGHTAVEIAEREGSRRHRQEPAPPRPRPPAFRAPGSRMATGDGAGSGRSLVDRPDPSRSERDS